MSATRSIIPPNHLASISREVLCLLPGAHNLERFRSSAEKSRVVVSGPMHDIGDGVRDFMEHGGAVRIGEHIMNPVVVVDRQIAFLTGKSRTRTLTEPSLVERLVTVFEAHWGSARAPRVDRLMSEQQHEVIVLLASGMTDEAVARKLDISQRTVQRHVRRVMELLGVHSRLELGVRLTRLGIL